MTEKILNGKQISLLERLSNEGYNIFLIIDKNGYYPNDIYIVQDFREAILPGIPFHSVRNYKKITNIIDKNSMYVHSINSLKVIITEIESIDVINREIKFDGNNFYWVKL